MALLLSAARRHSPEASTDAKDGRWVTWSPTGWLGSDLFGATLGIVGMGKIGKAVAERARGFGMKIVYTDPGAPPGIEAAQGATSMPLDELLSQSDFVSLHVPLTPETRGLISENRLRRMKPTAILVNTSRGPVVNTADLVLALQEGWIAAAALDVTDPEPLPPSHPVYHLSNCLIVPHIGSATHNTRRRMAELACENLLAGLEGRRLPNCVNPRSIKNATHLHLQVPRGYYECDAYGHRKPTTCASCRKPPSMLLQPAVMGMPVTLRWAGPGWCAPRISNTCARCGTTKSWK
jgi:phosphoglycerate dehydrogenase-like enzyme